MEIKLKLANSEDYLTKLNLSTQSCLQEVYDRIHNEFGLDKSEFVLISSRGVKLTQKVYLTMETLI